jgi:hypothetical protein
MQSVVIVGSAEQLAGLVSRDGVDVAKGTATQQPDGRWRVIAYVTEEVGAELTAEGLEVTLSKDSDELHEHWATVSAQVEPES